MAATCRGLGFAPNQKSGRGSLALGEYFKERSSRKTTQQRRRQADALEENLRDKGGKKPKRNRTGYPKRRHRAEKKKERWKKQDGGWAATLGDFLLGSSRPGADRTGGRANKPLPLARELQSMLWIAGPHLGWT